MSHTNVMDPKNPANGISAGVMKKISTATTEDELGRTLLHKAALDGSSDVVQMLIAANANVNARDQYGCTPLHLAVWRGHKDIAKLLVEHDARVDARDTGGHTPLDLAKLGTRDDMAAILLRRSKDLV